MSQTNQQKTPVERRVEELQKQAHNEQKRINHLGKLDCGPQKR
jgi:hypothetical protein